LHQTLESSVFAAVAAITSCPELRHARCLDAAVHLEHTIALVVQRDGVVFGKTHPIGSDIPDSLVAAAELPAIVVAPG